MADRPPDRGLGADPALSGRVDGEEETVGVLKIRTGGRFFVQDMNGEAVPLFTLVIRKQEKYNMSQRF